MKVKKIVSILLVSSLAVSISGCSFVNSTYDKTRKAIEKLGIEEEKAEKFFDELEEIDEKDWEDGLFSETSDSKYIKEFIKYRDSAFGLKKTNVNQVLFAQELSFDSGLEVSSFRITCIEFKDEESAEDFFENIIDAYENMDDIFSGYSDDALDFETDTSDDYFYMALELHSGIISNSCYVVSSIDKNVVTLLVVSTTDDDKDEFVDMMEEFCEEAGYDNPVDLL